MLRKAVEGFEGRYEILENSLIYSVKHRRFLNPSLKRHGYYSVKLYNGEKYVEFTVHSLVAHHFVDGYKEGLEVDHVDANKLNNHYTNLEWVSRSENQVRKHGFLYELSHATHGEHTTRNLKQFCLDNQLSQGTMWQVAQGQRGQHKGWRVVQSKL